MPGDPFTTLIVVLLFWGLVTGAVGFAFGYEKARRNVNGGTKDQGQARSH